MSSSDKVLEKIAHDQMYAFAESNKLINDLQSGFRKGHSTTTALIKVADDIREAIDRKKISLLVLLDFSKAFDRVNHRLLLIKLRRLGFSASVIKWLQHYLTGRMQRIFSGEDFISEWALVQTGVPQGSVLGPLLFILYLHDISNCLRHTNYHLYADDTQIYKHFKLEEVNEAVAHVNEDLKNLTTYISLHNLCLNVGKTQPIVIGSGNFVNRFKKLVDLPLVKINNAEVQYMEEVNNLGIIFDDTLCWRPQCNKMISKVFGTLAQARRNMSYLPTPIRKRIVQCLIMPLLDYGSQLFTDMNKTYTDKVQKAENACIRFITSATRFEHISPYYVQLGLLKYQDRRNLAVATLTWKIIKNNAPHYLRQKFDFSRRHDNLLIMPPSTLTDFVLLLSAYIIIVTFIPT